MFYASLFDCCDAYFGSTRRTLQSTIDSQDASSGAITHYNSNTNTDNLYIQMTATGQSLYKLCIKNPPAGVWTITIQAMTNTPVCFQFQTVPTADPYSTMKATLSLSSVLGSNWEDMAYAGFTNIANTQVSASEDVDDVSFIGILLALTALLTATEIAHASAVLMDIQNDQGDRKEATDTVTCAAAPTPSPTPSPVYEILLVDANGADSTSQFLYQGRENYVYSVIKIGAYSNKYIYFELVGENKAVKKEFISKLDDHNASLKFVSVGGHGYPDRVCGYTASGNKLFTPILETPDVTEELVNKDISFFGLQHCK